MRIAFFVLLLINLAFLAWTRWIAVPREAPASRIDPRLPSLIVMDERSGSGQTPTGSQAMQSAYSPESEAPGAQRCVAIGPFPSPEAARQTADDLRRLGLQAQAAGQPQDAPYWINLMLDPDNPEPPALSALRAGRPQLEIRPCSAADIAPPVPN